MAQGTTKGVPIDVDPLLAADSDLLVPSQKAIKTYVDTNFLNPSDLSAITPLTYSSSTGVFTINQASGSSNGYLSSTDWSTFNGKQNTVSLTTTGTSGAATFNSTTGALNIPQYSSIYLKNSTTYTATGLTGTQILTSVLIPANTFVAGDVLRVTARLKKTGTNNSGNFALGINSTLSVSGATTFKTNSIVATYPSFGVFAHAVIINATTNTQLPWPATNYGTSDIVFATAVLAGSWQENVAINWTIPQYLIFQSTLNSTADALSLIFYMIEKL